MGVLSSGRALADEGSLTRVVPWLVCGVRVALELGPTPRDAPWGRRSAHRVHPRRNHLVRTCLTRRPRALGARAASADLVGDGRPASVGRAPARGVEWSLLHAAQPTAKAASDLGRRQPEGRVLTVARCGAPSGVPRRSSAVEWALRRLHDGGPGHGPGDPLGRCLDVVVLRRTAARVRVRGPRFSG